MQTYKPVQSLQRGLHMIEFAATAEHGASLKELAETAGCSTPAAFHMAQTLVDAGFLRREENPVRFFPGDRLFALAANQPELQLDARMEEIMRQIHEALPGVSVFFCREHLEDVQVHLQWRSAADRLDRDIDYTLPPYTSVGSLAHLAFWPAERATRYFHVHDFSAHGLVLWADRPALDDFLGAIRRTGFFFLPVKNPSQLRSGFAVFPSEQRFLGSLTVSQDLPDGSDIEQARRLLQQTVQEILHRHRCGLPPAANAGTA